MLTVYTKPNCPHCVLAKQYLAEHAIAFAEVDVMQDQDALLMLKQAGHRTVPQIYRDGQLFVPGGNSGLRQLPKEYLLERLAS